MYVERVALLKRVLIRPWSGMTSALPHLSRLPLRIARQVSQILP
jgi:hypothetical protein